MKFEQLLRNARCTDYEELNSIDSIDTAIEKIIGFLKKNHSTHSGKALGSLCLNLYNHNSQSNLRLALERFDELRMAWAIYVIAYFFANGEDRKIIELGEKIRELDMPEKSSSPP